MRPGVAPPVPPICGTPVPGFDVAAIKAWMVLHRNRLNINNPVRTDFYLQYWSCHREIPWALLAHLVSRNAGYQMSDLDRFKQLSRAGIAIPGFPSGLSVLLLDDLFGFLESGNFLIFRDVFPQLAAYAWAKALLDQTHCDHSVALFDLLADPAFDVDPLMIGQWKSFFHAASRATPRWFAASPRVAGEPAVIRQSLALIANEQNHIETRIVNPHPLARPYVSPFHTALSVLLGTLGRLRLTKLIMAGGGAAAVDLFFHTVGNFTLLNERIETGRQLYYGVFLASAARSASLQSFAVAHPTHRGTRVDYDPLNYDIRRVALLPGGQKYSPPLVAIGATTPPWPIFPASDPRFAHISSPPTGIPSWSVATPPSHLARWLSPPTIDAFSPPQGNRDTQRADRALDEVVI